MMVLHLQNLPLAWSPTLQASKSSLSRGNNREICHNPLASVLAICRMNSQRPSDNVISTERQSKAIRKGSVRELVDRWEKIIRNCLQKAMDRSHKRGTVRIFDDDAD